MSAVERRSAARSGCAAGSSIADCPGSMMRTRALRLGLILGAIATIPACGGSEPTSGAFTIRFDVQRGERKLACKDVAGIDKVEVNVLSAATRTPVTGWPKDGDCATGI